MWCVVSRKGVGATAPDMSEFETLEDGVVVPLGHPKKQQTSKVNSTPLYTLYHYHLLFFLVLVWLLWFMMTDLLNLLQARLLYNEYIAYNVDQIRMRYVVHVNFNFNK